jgi:hypothetical protein
MLGCSLVTAELEVPRGVSWLVNSKCLGHAMSGTVLLFTILQQRCLHFVTIPNAQGIFRLCVPSRKQIISNFQTYGILFVNFYIGMFPCATAETERISVIPCQDFRECSSVNATPYCAFHVSFTS